MGRNSQICFSILFRFFFLSFFKVTEMIARRCNLCFCYITAVHVLNMMKGPNERLRAIEKCIWGTIADGSYLIQSLFICTNEWKKCMCECSSTLNSNALNVFYRRRRRKILFYFIAAFGFIIQGFVFCIVK